MTPSEPLFRRLSLPCLLLLSLVAATTPAAAQSPAVVEPGFGGLAARLRQGDRISIAGPGIGAVRGRLVAVSADRLTVRTDQGLRDVTPAEVDRIKRTRFGVLLGPIIGAGAGVALAIPVNMLIAAEGGDATRDTLLILAWTTGIGLGIDAAVNLPRTVYRRDRPARVQIAPQLGPHGGGVAMRVTF